MGPKLELKDQHDVYKEVPMEGFSDSGATASGGKQLWKEKKQKHLCEKLVRVHLGALLKPS